MTLRTTSDEERMVADLGDEGVDQMIELAERLRVVNGGVLSDEAVAAISEATGAPTDVVRLAVKLRADKRKVNPLENLRAQFMTLEPETRKFVSIGTLSVFSAFLSIMEAWLRTLDRGTGLFGMLAFIVGAFAVYLVALSKDKRTAAMSGAILAIGVLLGRALFSAILGAGINVPPPVIVPLSVLGAVLGVALHTAIQSRRELLGLKDPVKERQDLLRQLVDLQDKLRVGEQHCTFLSLDVVGSTRMKQGTDPLAVEFTFTEYHNFVQRVVERYGGRVHSTAGDGVTCAFPVPAKAYDAARNLQIGLVELNTHRNKLGIPIVLRAGIHTGTVNAPDASDITSVNFASVIDIAAHLQKEAPPGGIAVSDAAALYLPGGRDAVGSERVSASGIDATLWRPKFAVGALPTASADAPPAT